MTTNSATVCIERFFSAPGTMTESTVIESTVVESTVIESAIEQAFNGVADTGREKGSEGNTEKNIGKARICAWPQVSQARGRVLAVRAPLDCGRRGKLKT